MAKVSSSALPERRLLLLGKTGSGKSATGNTILGEKIFKSEFRAASITVKSELQQSVVAGRIVSVVDTPGVFDTSLSQDDIAKQLGEGVYSSSPGPHALLIVLQLGRFTQQEEQTVELIRRLSGKEAVKYTLILFTHGDYLEEKTIEEFIIENKALTSLVQQCGQRYHVFNNKDKTNRHQVTELLDKIERMVEENGGSPYTNEMFEDARRLKKDEFKKKYLGHFKKVALFAVAGAALGAGVGAVAVGAAAAGAAAGAGAGVGAGFNLFSRIRSLFRP